MLNQSEQPTRFPYCMAGAVKEGGDVKWSKYMQAQMRQLKSYYFSRTLFGLEIGFHILHYNVGLWNRDTNRLSLSNSLDAEYILYIIYLTASTYVVITVLKYITRIGR